MQQSLLATVAIFLFSTFLSASEWSEFRGPDGQGHVSASPPISWDAEKHVLWRKALPGSGWSSPVVSGKHIYLTAAVPVEESDDLSLQLLILDADSGELLKQVEIFQQDAETAPDIHGKNSHASPTPLVADDHVYVHFGHQGTACLTAAGDPVWKTQELSYPPVHGNGGSPILFDDLLIFSCDGATDPFVAALDKRTGEVRWKTERNSDASKNFSFSTPLVIEVAGQPQVISPGSNCVVAYAPADGREIWRVNYEGYSVVPRPVYGHGMVFIATGYDSPSVLAIRPDGEGDVSESHVAWTLKRGAPNTPSMLLIGDHLYMVSDRGVASCVDARTGESVWQERLGGNYSSSPLFANGRIYCQSEEGEGVVISADPEFKELARNDLGERTLASYGVIGNDLLIRTADHLYRIGSSTEN